MANTPYSPGFMPAGYRNIFEFGYVVGTDCAPKVMAAAAAGENVYFPGGFTYTFDTPVLLHGLADLAFIGDGRLSKLKSGAGLVKSQIFQTRQSANISWRYLLFEGRGVESGMTTTPQGNAIYGYEDEELEILGCGFTNFNGAVIFLQNTNGGMIHDNRFWKNPYDPLASADIQCSNFATTAPQRDLIVTKNRCLSSNKQGISLMGVVSSATVDDNIVVAMLDDGTEPNAPGEFSRKEGITLSYSVLNPFNEQWHISCCNNTIRNCAWNGIYVNTSTDKGGDFDRDAPYITITGNNIRRVCMDVQSTQSFGNQSGIGVLASQLVTVVANNISEVGILPGYTPYHDVAGVRVRSPGTFSSTNCTFDVTSNIITAVGNTLANGDVVHFMTSGDLTGTGISPGIPYYLRDKDISGVGTGTFKVELAPDTTEVNILAAGTPTHKVTMGTWTGEKRSAITIADNNIRDIYGNGVDINRDGPKWITVTGNNIIDCTESSITVWRGAGTNLDADIAERGLIECLFETNIVGNNLINKRYTSGQLILISGDYRIHRPHIVGNRMKTEEILTSGNLININCEEFTLLDNWIEGTAYTHHTGVKIQAFADQSKRRTMQIQLGHNRFAHLAQGYEFTGGSSHYGPIVDQGSTFFDVPIPCAGGLHVIAGRIICTNVEIYATAQPTYGWWTRGDRVLNSLPSVDQPVGWVCTVAGTPGTWVALPNL